MVGANQQVEAVKSTLSTRKELVAPAGLGG